MFLEVLEYWAFIAISLWLVLWMRWKMSMTSHMPTCLLLCSLPNLSLSPSETTSPKNKCFLIWLPVIIFYGSWRNNKDIGHIYRVGKCPFLCVAHLHFLDFSLYSTKYIVACFLIYLVSQSMYWYDIQEIIAYSKGKVFLFYILLLGKLYFHVLFLWAEFHLWSKSSSSLLPSMPLFTIFLVLLSNIIFIYVYFSNNIVWKTFLVLFLWLYKIINLFWVLWLYVYF